MCFNFKWVNTARYTHFVVNSYRSERDIVCGSTRVSLLYFEYCSYLGVGSIVVQTLCVSGYRYFLLVDTERITEYGFSVIEH